MTSTRACILLAIWAASVASAAEQGSRLVTAAANQDRGEALALIAEGADVNEARADGATALLWAAHWDDLELARRLLRAGADVNAAEDHGVTALARAVENTSLAMVETLIAAGADVNAAQISGLAPLMTAARTGDADVVRALLAQGADVNAATTRTRATALMWAVARPHPKVVRILHHGCSRCPFPVTVAWHVAGRAPQFRRLRILDLNRLSGTKEGKRTQRSVFNS